MIVFPQINIHINLSKLVLQFKMFDLFFTIQPLGFKKITGKKSKIQLKPSLTLFLGYYEDIPKYHFLILSNRLSQE